MAIGTAPMVIPQGVKMLPMNAAVVASAARNGQSVGPGNSSLLSGSASSVRVVSTIVFLIQAHDYRLIWRGIPQRFAAVDGWKMQEVIAGWG